MARAPLGLVLGCSAGLACIVCLAGLTTASGCSYDFTLGPDAPASEGGASSGAGGPTRTCKAAEPCKVDCLGGGCITTCAAGSACEVNCVGGNCNTTCAAGSACTVNCLGGNCTTSCPIGSSCEVNCTGACSCTGEGCK